MKKLYYWIFGTKPILDKQDVLFFFVVVPLVGFISYILYFKL